MLLTLLGIGVLALSKEVVLGINLCGGHELNKVLVGVGSLSFQGLSRKGSP